MSDSDLTYLTDRAHEQIAALVKEAFNAGHQAGYKAGYSAAIATVMQAAPANANLTQGEQASDTFDRSSATSSAADTHVTRPAPSPETTEPIPKTISGRAAPGSIKNLVKQFVLTAGKPVREADFAFRYPNIIRPSRYMAFRTLGADGVIVKRDGFWVPAPEGGGNPDGGSSGSSQRAG